MKTRILAVFAVAFFIVSVTTIGTATAQGSFESITAQKAYDMVTADEADLVDIRTTEEYYWVGNPADAAGNPIAYNIPWELWHTFSIKEDTDNPGYYKPAMKTVKILFRFLIWSTFGRPEVAQPLIIMCRSGKRTGDPLAAPGDADYRAGNYLKEWGYTVYEIDNPNKNGLGGFQGSSSSSPGYVKANGCPTTKATDYEVIGYRAWPGRVKKLAKLRDPDWVPPGSTESVSWMDSALPITQKIDKTLVWCYMWLH